MCFTPACINNTESTIQEDHRFLCSKCLAAKHGYKCQRQGCGKFSPHLYDEHYGSKLVPCCFKCWGNTND